MVGTILVITKTSNDVPIVNIEKTSFSQAETMGMFANIQSGESFKIPKGTYVIDSTSSGRVWFNDLSDVTIDASDATFVIKNSATFGINFFDCQNINWVGGTFKSVEVPDAAGSLVINLLGGNNYDFSNMVVKNAHAQGGHVFDINDAHNIKIHNSSFIGLGRPGYDSVAKQRRPYDDPVDGKASPHIQYAEVIQADSLDQNSLGNITKKSNGTFKTDEVNHRYIQQVRERAKEVNDTKLVKAIDRDPVAAFPNRKSTNISVYHNLFDGIGTAFGAHNHGEGWTGMKFHNNLIKNTYKPVTNPYTGKYYEVVHFPDGKQDVDSYNNQYENVWNMPQDRYLNTKPEADKHVGPIS